MRGWAEAVWGLRQCPPKGGAVPDAGWGLWTTHVTHGHRFIPVSYALPTRRSLPGFEDYKTMRADPDLAPVRGAAFDELLGR